MSDCCKYHEAQLPAGSCNQGRNCPERTRRQQESEYRKAPVGYESAHPIVFLDDEPEIQGVAEAILRGLAALAAIGVAIGGFLWAVNKLSPLLWPQLVAALS
jgi:hypothetical protein